MLFGMTIGLRFALFQYAADISTWILIAASL
jgi:hypothetical protein